ncbi:MAG: hypothetical protein KAT04_15450 [Methylococcales bacterium]|nr:hypothetical protein [Methylococcales bacterium]
MDNKTNKNQELEDLYRKRGHAITAFYDGNWDKREEITEIEQKIKNIGAIDLTEFFKT